MMRWLVMLLVAVFTLPAEADERTARPKQALRASQTAIGSMIPDVVFTNAKGRPVRMSDFRGRPLLVTLVYTGCADVCPMLIEGLAPAVEVARETFGPDAFSIITVGFDVRQDTPDKMRSFARTHGINLSNWQFLATNQAGLDALARAVGFAYYSRAGGYDHAAQVSLVDAQGRLYQQVYGTNFDAPLIVEPLKDLIYGRDRPLLSFQGLVDRVRWFCTTYDPNSGRYRFDYSFFLSIAIGLVSLSFILGLIVREWRRSSVDHGDQVS